MKRTNFFKKDSNLPVEAGKKALFAIFTLSLLILSSANINFVHALYVGSQVLFGGDIGSRAEIKWLKDSSSYIYDDWHLNISTDDHLFLKAPNRINLITDYLDFNKGGSLISNIDDLKIETDDYLHLNANKVLYIGAPIIDWNKGGSKLNNSGDDLWIETDDNMMLKAEGTVSISNDLSVTQTLKVGGGYGDSGATIGSTGAIETNGSITTGSGLTVKGTTTLDGETNINGTSITLGNGSDDTLTINAVTKLYGNQTIIGEAGDAVTVHGTTTFAENVKLYLDSTDTYIYANTDDPEDLVIGADQDILLEPDGNFNVTPSGSGGGFIVQGHATSPNILAGYSGNSIADGVYGAGILGGGTSGGALSIGANDHYSVIVGGYDNSITAGTNLGHAHFIGAGTDNTIDPTFNIAYAAIVAGQHNIIDIMGNESFIGGGNTNHTQGSQDVIGGGVSNTTSPSYGGQAAICGGQSNTAYHYAFIGGGASNTASGNGSVASGGYINTASGAQATVPGGNSNTASGSYSFAAGRRAKATTSGVFALADSTNADFTVGTANVLGSRFSGGYWLTGGNLGIGTTDPSYKLEVSGTGYFSGYLDSSTAGLATIVNAGACTDTQGSVNGALCIDSTNGRIYYRYGGAWHYTAKDAGFQIPSFEINDPISGEELNKGDYVIGTIDDTLSDGALHGRYTKFDKEELDSSILDLDTRVEFLESAHNLSGVFEDIYLDNNGSLLVLDKNTKVKGDLELDNGLKVGGDAEVAGDINITGDLTARDLNIRKLSISGSVGATTIEAGKTSVEVESELVAEGSRIFVTPESSTNNQVLYIKEKIAGERFIINLENPLEHDIIVNWWIIN